jgi:hypothetical protein
MVRFRMCITWNFLAFSSIFLLLDVPMVRRFICSMPWTWPFLQHHDCVAFPGDEIGGGPTVEAQVHLAIIIIRINMGNRFP